MHTRHLVLIAAALFFGIAPSVKAGDPPPGARPGSARPVAVRAGSPSGASFGSARGTSILGNAWTADNAPVKNAQLRLRNVATGKVEAHTVANDAGQFAFTNIEGGSYVVEMVNESGRLLTVGHVFNIAPGETVGTFVRLGTKVPWFTGFFGNTATAAASSAASQGITALAPIVRPATSGQ